MRTMHTRLIVAVLAFLVIAVVAARIIIFVSVQSSDLYDVKAASFLRTSVRELYYDSNQNLIKKPGKLDGLYPGQGGSFREYVNGKYTVFARTESVGSESDVVLLLVPKNPTDAWHVVQLNAVVLYGTEATDRLPEEWKQQFCQMQLQ